MAAQAKSLCEGRTARPESGPCATSPGGGRAPHLASLKIKCENAQLSRIPFATYDLPPTTYHLPHRLIDAFRVLVHAALMEDQFRRVAFTAIGYEGDLRIDNGEEIAWSLSGKTSSSAARWLA